MSFFWRIQACSGLEDFHLQKLWLGLLPPICPLAPTLDIHPGVFNRSRKSLPNAGFSEQKVMKEEKNKLCWGRGRLIKCGIPTKSAIELYPKCQHISLRIPAFTWRDPNKKSINDAFWRMSDKTVWSTISSGTFVFPDTWLKPKRLTPRYITSSPSGFPLFHFATLVSCFLMNLDHTLSCYGTSRNSRNLNITITYLFEC